MIRWMDFVLDDPIGVTLSFGGEEAKQDGAGVMDDERLQIAIQEMGQELWPARMVGLSGSKFARTDMEVRRDRSWTYQPLEAEGG